MEGKCDRSGVTKGGMLGLSMCEGQLGRPGRDKGRIRGDHHENRSDWRQWTDRIEAGSKLREQGREAVAASPNSGVNSITGEGLAEAPFNQPSGSLTFAPQFSVLVERANRTSRGSTAAGLVGRWDRTHNLQAL